MRLLNLISFLLLLSFESGKTVYAHQLASVPDCLLNSNSSTPYVDNFFSKRVDTLKEGQEISLELFQGLDSADVRCFRSDKVDEPEDTSIPVSYYRVIRWFEILSQPVQYSSEKLFFVQEHLKILDTNLTWGQSCPGNSFFIYHNKISKIEKVNAVVQKEYGFGSDDQVTCYNRVLNDHYLYVLYREYIPSAPPDNVSFSYFSFDSSGSMNWFQDLTETSAHSRLIINNNSALFDFSIGCLALHIPVKFNFEKFIIEFNLDKPFFENYSGNLYFLEGEIKLYVKPNENSKFQKNSVSEEQRFEVIRVFNKDYQNGFNENNMWYLIKFGNNTGWVKYSSKIVSIMSCG